MNTTRSILWMLSAFSLSFVSAGTPARAEPPVNADCSASELLPKTVVIYAATSGLGPAIDTIFNHPLRRRIESLPAYEEVVKSGSLSQLNLGVAAFEASMGKPWQKSIDALTEGGVSIAIDPGTDGIALLIKCKEAGMLQRLQGFLLALGQMKEGKLSPIEQGDYRGFTAYRFSKELKLAIIGPWMLITNKSDLGKSIIDQYLDRKDESLKSSEWFSHAVKEQESRDVTPLVSAYIDVATIRSAGVAKELFNDKTDNPVAEVLFGGVLANLVKTPVATATFILNADGANMQLSSPHDVKWQSPREYFFGEDQQVAAPPLLDIPNRLFAISAHRDLSQMWLRSGDILTEQANEGIAKADTQLTTFFSGRDFGEDILGALESDIQIVGTSQDFTGILPQPATKLPAFAIQFRMKTPDETIPEFRRIFQSFIGFLNVVGAMDGQPQFDLGMETIGDAKLYTATYIAMRDNRESMSAPINFNFSPTIAFAGDRLILSSTIPLARELAGTNLVGSNEVASRNTAGILDAKILKQVLGDNRSQLVANNMLEKGHTKQAAEAEIGLLLEIVNLFKEIETDLDVTDQSMSLNLRISVDQE